MFERIFQPKLNNRKAWNAGIVVGKKKPLELKEIWTIQSHLERKNAVRELAMFNLALDSKLRGCDLVTIKVVEVRSGNDYLSRVERVQQKTNTKVTFEITEQTRRSLHSWIDLAGLTQDDYLFPGRKEGSHLSASQYRRIVKSWVIAVGLNPSLFGSHSMRRTKPTHLYRKTKNIRACQLLLGHSNLDSTVRYLGVEVDDALQLSEQLEF